MATSGKGKTVSLLLAVLFLSLMSSGCISLGSNGDGMATDKVARVEKAGWIWSTWRVQLLNDHPVSKGEYGVDQQRYGIENDAELIAQLQGYAATGKTVRIYYHSKFLVFDWEFSDPDVIYKVEPAE